MFCFLTEPNWRVSRRALGAAAAGLLAAGVATRFGWMAAKLRTERSTHSAFHGYRGTGPSPPQGGAPLWPAQLRVTGPSMSPELMGAHAELTCDACGVTWAAHWHPAPVPPAAVICWNCGASVSTESAAFQPGSLVQLELLSPTGSPPAVGELVAIEFPAQTGTPANDGIDHLSAANLSVSPSLSVKRIVAIPGQSITHRRGQMLVDGHPPLPETAWIPVHDDSHRRDGDSWWKALPRSADRTSVQITDEGFELRANRDAAGNNDWLVYHHRAVHNQMRPDQVRDDVPGNVAEVRPLLPASRLRLSLQVRPRSPGFKLEVAFWDGDGTVGYSYELREGAEALQIVGPSIQDRFLTADTDPEQWMITAGYRAENIGLSENSPIAIRALSGAARLSQIRIDRPLQYLIDQRLAATLRWPVVLGADEYFVLGDNVPLSVDSRHFGPIARSRIVGRIRQVVYDGAPR